MPTKRKPRAAQLGVTDDQYARLLAAQGGGCAICGNPPKTRRLHVDHDHKTGAVRGLLCFRCNRFLHPWMTFEWFTAGQVYVQGLGGGSFSFDWETQRRVLDEINGTRQEGES